MFKRFTALCIILALVCTCSSCASRKPGKSGSSQASQELTLPYSSSDSTDPYACKSETNMFLTQLIYDSLFVINNDKTLTKHIAESYVQQDTTITVKLANVKFSDGSMVTADDVVHSFSRAKQSSRYKQMLGNFDAAQKKGSDVVRFTLLSKNVYALNVLSFPIVKQKNNFIGSGPYKLEQKDAETFLEYNKHYSSKKPKIERFALTECREYSGAVNLFNNGKIDYLFDALSDGNVRSNAINSKKAKLNNFLFLGLNAKKGVLKNRAFRNALSLAINQTELCSQALQGFAVATATPFDSEWNEIGSVVSHSVLSKANEAAQAFEQAGYSYDKMGINLLWKDNPIHLTLVVNSANNMKIALAQLIKTQLVNFGIDVEIKKMPLDEYTIAVVNESFDMYIGEVKIQNDFNLDCFFTEDGGAHFGINSPSLEETYLLFKGGNAGLQEFVSEFSEQTPFIPIGYKCADVCLNASLKVPFDITENTMYAGIEEWSR